MKMKNFFILILLSFPLFFFSCQKLETENASGLLVFRLKGEQIMLVTINTPYNEPGYEVSLRGEDLISSVVVSGVVDSETVGIYNLSYELKNKDGVITTKSRQVIVCDPSVTTDISGKYTTLEGTNRKSLETGGVEEYSGQKVIVKLVAPGFFEVSDFIGGYYDQLRGYGGAYAFKGYMQLNSDNSLSLLSSYLSGWGLTLSELENASYDPEEKTLSWETSFSKLRFTVLLK